MQTNWVAGFSQPQTAQPDIGIPFRQRLLNGMAGAVREHGYATTTVCEIAHRAQTSRRTFYAHFSSKQECFLTLHDQRNNDHNMNVLSAVDPHASLPTQVRQAVDAWLAFVEADPVMELSWLRDTPRLGEAGRRLQRDTREAFVRLLHTLTDTPDLRAEGVRPVPRRKAIVAFGGLNELITITLEDGEEIRDTTEPAVDFTLAILGPHS